MGKEEETNKYLFRMRSKAACERKLVHGSNCKISDVVTGVS